MPRMFQLNDLKISELKKGEFAIPDLVWDLDTVLLVGEVGSIKAMATHMLKSGQSNLITEIKNELGDKLSAEQLMFLIKREIENIHQTGQFEKVFHLIQLWGGKEARHFYIHGCTIDETRYSHFVSQITSTESINEVVLATKSFINATKRLNIAFATKHVSIWQRFSQNSMLRLPIYDSIMALNVMGRYTRNKNGKAIGFVANDYPYLHKYWVEMKTISDELRVPINNIERQLFNFFRSGTPDSWPRKFQ